MIPFPASPDRPPRFVATRAKGADLSGVYKANAIGLWTGLFDTTKSIKIEWKQVPSIQLPFTKIE